MRRSVILLVFIFLTCTLRAQKWNVESPPGPSKKVTITTNEGTWMNLDVSPDGQNIVFDTKRIGAGFGVDKRFLRREMKRHHDAMDARSAQRIDCHCGSRGVPLGAT